MMHIRNSKELKEREDTLIKLTKQIEKLEALMQDRKDISAKYDVNINMNVLFIDLNLIVIYKIL